MAENDTRVNLSPLPWRAAGDARGEWRIETCGAWNDVVARIEPWSPAADKADAEFIVLACNAHDQLIEVNAYLLATLKAVVSTGRAGLCWCDASHDVEVYGHQAKCVQARIAVVNAIARGEDK